MQKIKADLARFTSRLTVFEGMTELAQYARDNAANTKHSEDDRDKWYGKSWRDALTACELGDLSLVEKSDALLSKLESVTPQSARRVIVADVAGAVPNVQAYIAGQPLNMRRRAKQADEIAPLTVYADVFASCGFTHDQIMTRGAAVLALVRSLSAIRPVQLYVGCSTQRDKTHWGEIVRIDTQPLDLARAAYALASPAFLRRVTFAALDADKAPSYIPAPNNYSIKEAIAPAIDGPILLAPPLIGSPSYADALAWNNPEQWIMNQLKQAGNADYSEAA